MNFPWSWMLACTLALSASGCAQTRARTAKSHERSPVALSPVRGAGLLADQASGQVSRQAAPVLAQAQQLQDGAGCSIADLVERVRPAVVGVTTQREVDSPFTSGEFDNFWRRYFGGEPPPSFGGPSVERGLGSGFIIDPRGLVITNHHVIEGADIVRVRTADGTELDAVVKGVDPPTDIALLQIQNLECELPAAVLGDSDAIRVGDCVVAIGDAFGLELTVTRGIISAKAREIGETPYDQFLQTDAAINPGNSGGPLFDLSGRVVGINTAIVATGQGIGFAVPINLVKSLLPQLQATGRVVRGFIGVSVQDLTPRLAEALGVQGDKGAVVASVERDGPAAKAGLKQGDVIVSLQGEPVEDAADLSRRIAQLQPGARARIEYVRDGERRSVEIVLTERRDGSEAPRP
ncbi:MAG: S1C family serine protease, partial [Myxococcales bacterium]